MRASDFEFLSGGESVGQLMRRFDWAQSPLGEPATWPQSLRAAVSICLGTTFPIAIYWGRELALLYNEAWSSIPGEKHPWALGRAGREVWPEIWSEIGPLFEKVQQSGEGVWQQDQLLPMNRHGYTEECYFNFTFSPIRGDAGDVEGIFNAVIETTSKVIGERRERALRHLAERVAGARSDQEVFKAADAVCALHGEDLPFCLFYTTRDDLVLLQAGATSKGMLSDESADLFSARFEDTLGQVVGRAVAIGQSQILDQLPSNLTSLSASSPWPELVRTALVIPLPLRGGSASPSIMIAGISPRRALDVDYRAFLERAAAHIAGGLANARAYEEERQRAEALAEVDRAKTLFFANVSHEFRTPLTLMIGPIEDALAELGEQALEGVQRERLETARRNSLRLLKLVNTLLDFSRIEAGRTQARFQPQDIATLTAEIASNFRSAMEKAGLQFRVAAPTLSESVSVDSELWEKIILNLLSNAFKFTFEGCVTVAVTEEAGRAVVTVSDTGVGVPPQELPRLFDRFHRVEGQKSRSFEGSGIGLALVKELVTLHRGTIEVESEQARGTSFRISLPLGGAHLPPGSREEDEKRVSSPVRARAYVDEALRWLPDGIVDDGASNANPHTRDGRRVLIADDNGDMREYLRRLLEPRWQVETASDGEEALASVQRHMPDLLLTDVMMPRLDGVGLVKAIRSDPNLRGLSVIMLSARAGEEARVDGLAAGADDYLVKPFSARELIARVAANLELAKARSELTRELRESESRFRNMADYAPVMVWVTAADGSCTFLSKSWYDFTGQTPEDALGFGWLSAVHPEDSARAGDAFFAANAAQKTFRIDYRLRRRDGEYRWAIDAASPRFGSDGAFLGYIGSVLDITERKQAEDQTNILLQEVNHRSKNILAVVQAVARQTAASSSGDFVARFGERVQALAAAQDLLVSNSWRGVDMRELILSQLAHFGDDVGKRISMQGPSVFLTAQATQALGMAFHELATNAVKYGALSASSGKVEIVWTLTTDNGGMRRLTISWTETGGPLVRPPDRRGFGSNVIDRMLKPVLGGVIKVEFAPEGLRWTVATSDDRALDLGGSTINADAEEVPGEKSERKRVLVVEDEPLIAMDIANVLEEAGYVVVGPAGDVTEALALLEATRVEHAVLDVNLGRETSEAIARRLQDLQIPFVSLSGYSRDQQPRIFHQSPALTKPLRKEALLAEIERAVRSR